MLSESSSSAGSRVRTRPESRSRVSFPVPAPFRCGPLAKLVHQVGVPFEQGHAVHVGLGSQGDGDGAAGGDGPASPADRRPLAVAVAGGGAI